jgi:hypothetical protein
MDHTPLDQGMFWAGAFMALTPIIVSAIVLTVWWKKKKHDRQDGGRGPSTSERVT